MSDLASLRERLEAIGDQVSLDLLDAHLMALSTGADDPRIERCVAIGRGDDDPGDGHLSYPLIVSLLAREVDRLRVRVVEPDWQTVITEDEAREPDPVERVRVALRSRVVPHPEDVRALLGAHDSRGRALDRANQAIRHSQQREAELVSRLAGRVPAPHSPLADQPEALSEARELVAPGTLLANVHGCEHMRELLDQVATEFGHYTGLRRRWLDDQHAGAQLREALAAFPESVAPYDGEPPTSLADRVRALASLYDMCRAGWGRCHHRHLDVEAGARAMVAAETGGMPDNHPVVMAKLALADVLARHRADGDGSHIPADHAVRTMPRHAEIVAALRELLADLAGPRAVGNTRRLLDRLAALLDAEPITDCAPPERVTNGESR